jgi:hypothetical protein
MRLFLSFLVLAFLGLVQALSSSGSRLLVVLEEAADKALYSKFWADLEGWLNPAMWNVEQSCIDGTTAQVGASSSRSNRRRTTSYLCSDMES